MASSLAERQETHVCKVRLSNKMSKENAMDASRGRSRKGGKNRGVSAKCSRGSRSSGSVLVALWGNVTAPAALICNDTGGSACVDHLVGNVQTYKSGKVCVRGLSDRRSAKIIPAVAFHHGLPSVTWQKAPRSSILPLKSRVFHGIPHAGSLMESYDHEAKSF